MEKTKVTGKQFVTEMCFGCGVGNHFGLHGRFYNTHDGKVVAVFQPGDRYQGYPQRLHGGITSSIMDETLGRAIIAIEPDCWVVTVELTVRFKKPVPLDTPLKVMAEVTENTRRLYRSSGSMILPDGEIAATAKATYMKQALDAITDMSEVPMGSVRIEQDLDVDLV